MTVKTKPIPGHPTYRMTEKGSVVDESGFPLKKFGCSRRGTYVRIPTEKGLVPVHTKLLWLELFPEARPYHWGKHKRKELKRPRG